MTWLIGIVGVLIGYIFTLKGKVAGEEGLVGNINTAAKVKPIQKEIDGNNAAVSAEQQQLTQQEKQVQNESLQDLESFFNRNLKQ